MNSARKNPLNVPAPALSRKAKASTPLLQSGASVLAAGVLALLSAAGPAYATPFSFYYTDTVSYSEISGILVGDAAKITVTLDNGGASLDSQTWTAANLQSVAFDFGNGTLLTTFLTPFNGGLFATNGNFVTNASGQLTSVLSDWEAFNPGTDYTTNGNAPGGWLLNGANAAVYLDNAFNKVDLNNVDSMLQASSWQGGQNPVSVPEPGTLWLMLPGFAGLWLSGKCRKA